jgi:hypothetical protein
MNFINYAKTAKSLVARFAHGEIQMALPNAHIFLETVDAQNVLIVLDLPILEQIIKSPGKSHNK